MRPLLRRVSWRLAVAIALAALPGHGAAALGDDASTIAASAARLKGTVSASAAARYTRHEIVQGSGTSLRQYVSPAGRIFAVAWQGPVVPDLREVLGPYFDRYVNAASERRLRRMPVELREADLVVVTGGRLRAFRGFAYLPALTPAQVDPETLP